MSIFGLPLGRLYGPAWLNGELWFPGYKCVWTAEKDQSGHHCPDQKCDAEIKTRCYDQLHVAFCLEAITMANGHKRFCGHRFQAESPKACALHGWGTNNENRIFQHAKKRMPFKLPNLIPHEQPGWEMVLTHLGGLHQPVHIRTGLVDGEFCFVRVLSWRADEQPDQVHEIARVKTKELQMTSTDPHVGLVEDKAVVQISPVKKGIQALAKTELNDEEEFNNPCSFQKYVKFNALSVAERKLAEKRAKEAKNTARAAGRAATTKGCKRYVQLDATKQLRMMNAKKKQSQ
ncbi:uncharacterized protein M421DRAFT_95969 [Didymella exigua CBS 183.55]|uniref:Uncharacterized protein n=1 Tax=Didymella exigua CBS 183.55 TaxID=1150837 RepID=A0A6A5R7H9_9PLEO|nr:uncharacterized protein M421DRAFT_95969 [Didymella exigua CBS 183.55]KAF1923702.1 hypothetical protein M421DRAFT_95969 [Didymella exigua CBS 183.55]